MFLPFCWWGIATLAHLRYRAIYVIYIYICAHPFSVDCMFLPPCEWGIAVLVRCFVESFKHNGMHTLYQNIR